MKKDQAEELADELYAKFIGDRFTSPEGRRMLLAAIHRHYPPAKVLCGNCGHTYLEHKEDHLHGIWVEGQGHVCKPPRRKK